ncbi:hypothetical protein CEXT_147351 [Caerostris extrusa]|uniref:Uncharacterized protein n=1 Tax=Caerostris extrusa TaxID=172846 RepID=A0AAV4M663_CAEEX|nr:hypothetical protein CEXT_147351 [Caerostris extrusa]
MKFPRPSCRRQHRPGAVVACGSLSINRSAMFQFVRTQLCGERQCSRNMETFCPQVVEVFPFQIVFPSPQFSNYRLQGADLSVHIRPPQTLPFEDTSLGFLLWSGCCTNEYSNKEIFVIFFLK